MRFNSLTKKCVCGTEYLVSPSRLKDGRGKFCSKKCQYENAHRPSGLTYEIKVQNKGWFTYERVGWTNSPDFKTGKWHYRAEAKRKGFLKECEVCGSTNNLYIHHKDGNRENNDYGNWMTVCAKCHCNEFHPRKFYSNQYTKT